MDIFTVAFVLISVVIGSALQRLSGMGLALVAAPVFSIILGPVNGIIFMNLIGIVSSAIVMITMFKNINWIRFSLVFPGIVLGAFVGALIVRDISAGLLQVVIGLIVLTALVTTYALPSIRVTGCRLITPTAGFATGISATAAGVASPPMVIYARLIQWPQESFAGTLQPIFIITASVAVISKFIVGAAAGSQFPPVWIFFSLVGALLFGVYIGGAFSRRVSSDAGRRICILIALTGSLTAIVRGVISFW